MLRSRQELKLAYIDNNPECKTQVVITTFILFSNTPLLPANSEFDEIGSTQGLVLRPKREKTGLHVPLIESKVSLDLRFTVMQNHFKVTDCAQYTYIFCERQRFVSKYELNCTHKPLKQNISQIQV